MGSRTVPSHVQNLPSLSRPNQVIASREYPAGPDTALAYTSNDPAMEAPSLAG